MPEDKSETDSIRDLWLKTARGRLRFELAGLSFARQKGFTPEEYACHLWSKGAKSWMKNASPGAGEYLQKEAEAFRCLYPEVGFAVVEAGEGKAELAFTGGCLGGWGDDPWALARSLGLTKEDVCRYCHEAFRLWAGQLGLRAIIGLEEGGSRCSLRIRRD